MKKYRKHPTRTCPSQRDQSPWHELCEAGSPGIQTDIAQQHVGHRPQQAQEPFPLLLSHWGSHSTTIPLQGTTPIHFSSRLRAKVLQHMRVSSKGEKSEEVFCSPFTTNSEILGKGKGRERVSSVSSLPLTINQNPGYLLLKSHSSYLWATDSRFFLKKKRGHRGRNHK